MSNIDVKLEMLQNAAAKEMAFAVKFCGSQVMSWHQAENSSIADPIFGSIAQFGQNQWKVFGHSGTWENAWLGEERNPGMEVALADLTEVSKAAVRAMFGPALNLKVAEVEDGYHVTLDGSVVLTWSDPFETGEFICFDTSDECNMFVMFTRDRHGFVPWNDGDSDYAADAQFSPVAIPQVSMFAYRALLLSQGGAV